MSENNKNIDPTDIDQINIYEHMQLNILNQDKNCCDKEEDTYYCIECKKSTCDKCDKQTHINHKMIRKSAIYNLDSNFLQDIIRDTANYENIYQLKKEAFEALEANYNNILKELEIKYKLKKRK